jgi:hopanoid-associated phosphorylase
LTVLVVTGMAREERILAALGAPVVIAGGDARRLGLLLERRIADVTALASVGIAGGLAPDLRPGQWIVADRVGAEPTDRRWSDRLAGLLPACVAGVVGSDRPVMSADRKAALHRSSGCAAVDMESHVVAAVARRHGRPFAVARVVADPAARDLPPFVGTALRPDGSVDRSALLRGIAAAPWQLPALAGLALDAAQAFLALRRGCRRLGADLGHLPADVP